MTTYGTDFNIYDIKPKNVEKSDKYSANLYKYFNICSVEFPHLL